MLCIFLAMYTICCHEVQIFSGLSDMNDSWVTKTEIIFLNMFLSFCLNILLEKLVKADLIRNETDAKSSNIALIETFNEVLDFFSSLS